jgi:hypothetical protein
MTPEIRERLRETLCDLLSSVTDHADEQDRLAVEVIALVLAAQHAADAVEFSYEADEVLAAHQQAWELAEGGDLQ